VNAASQIVVVNCGNSMEHVH